MCSRRLTNPSMGSLPGSLIQRETRSSYGSRLKANEQAPLLTATNCGLTRHCSRQTRLPAFVLSGSVRCGGFAAELGAFGERDNVSFWSNHSLLVKRVATTIRA